MESLYDHLREPLQMIFYDCKAILNLITREEDCQNETVKMVNDINRFFGVVNVYLSANLFQDGSIQIQHNPQMKLESKKFFLYCLISSCNSFRNYLYKFIQSSKCVDVNTTSTIYNLVKSNLNSMILLLLESSRKIIKVLKPPANNIDEIQSDELVSTISSKFITQMKTLTEYCCEPTTLNRDTFEYMKSQYMSTWQQLLNLMNECLLDVSNEITILSKTVIQLLDDLGMIFELTIRSYSQPSLQIEALAMKVDVDKCILEIVDSLRVAIPLLTQSQKRVYNCDTLQFAIPLVSIHDDDQFDTDDHASLNSGSNSNRSSIISIDGNNSIKHSSSNLENYLYSSSVPQTPLIRQPTKIDSIPKSTSLNDMVSSNKQQINDCIQSSSTNGGSHNSSTGDLPIIISLDSDDEDDEDKPTIWSLPISTVSGDPFQKNKIEARKEEVLKAEEKKKKWYQRIINNKPKDGTNSPTSGSNSPVIQSQNSLTSSTNSAGGGKKQSSPNVNINSPTNSSTSSTPSYSTPNSTSRPATPSVDQLLSSTSNNVAIPMIEVTAIGGAANSNSSGSQRIMKTNSFLNLANVITHIGDGDDDCDEYELSLDINDTPVGYRGSVQDKSVALFESFKDFTVEEVGERSKRYQPTYKTTQTVNIGFENNERHITHYESHFYGQDHYNFVGLVPELGGNMIVSVKKEADVLPGNDKRHRVLIITKNSTEKILLRSSSSKESDLLKAVLTYLKPIVKLSTSSLKTVKTESLQSKLLQFEKNNVKKQYHFFLLFAGDVQTACSQMINNDKVSKEFVDFHKFLGKTFQTKNWNKYSGGLDISHNLDGNSAVYTEINDIEIVFHVSSMLLYHKRKEFLSKNTVVLIYHEGSKPLSLSTFDTNSNQVFFDIRKVKGDDGSQINYKLGTIYHQSISPFGPMLPEPSVFKKDQFFKQYLLTKLINATNSTLLCPHITKDLVKNREIEINNIISRRPPSLNK